MFSRLRKASEAVGHVGNAWTFAGLVGWQAKLSAISAGMLTWAATFFGAAGEGLTVTAVWVASLAAGLLVSIIVLVITVIVAILRFPRVDEAAKAVATGTFNEFADAKSKELAGVINAMMERALGYNFRFPLKNDDAFIKHYAEIENSDHVSWAEPYLRQLRRDFLNRCGRLGVAWGNHLPRDEIGELKQETRTFGDKIIAKLTGRAPDLDVSPNYSVATLWDFYEPFCAVTVQNISSLDAAGCLIQVEQFSGVRPKDMPMPLVLRTENQIREKQSGRFNLSAGQPKNVPILYCESGRPNEWYFVDTQQNWHTISTEPTKIVLGVYGGRKSGRVLVCVEPGDTLPPKFTVEGVPLDYSL